MEEPDRKRAEFKPQESVVDLFSFDTPIDDRLMPRVQSDREEHSFAIMQSVVPSMDHPLGGLMR